MTDQPKPLAIIVDLDGTLADCEHRRHFIEGDPDDPTVRKDWKSFYESMSEDPVNQWCEHLVNLHFAADIRVILTTGRPAQYRKLTEAWLSNNAIPFDELYMRAEGDFRADELIKEEIYKTKIEPAYRTILVVDDRAKVVKKWRELGLTCLQCSEGNY